MEFHGALGGDRTGERCVATLVCRNGRRRGTASACVPQNAALHVFRCLPGHVRYLNCRTRTHPHCARTEVVRIGRNADVALCERCLSPTGLTLYAISSFARSFGGVSARTGCDGGGATGHCLAHLSLRGDDHAAVLRRQQRGVVGCLASVGTTPAACHAATGSARCLALFVHCCRRHGIHLLERGAMCLADCRRAAGESGYCCAALSRRAVVFRF